MSRHRAEHRQHWQNCPEGELPAGFWAGVPRPRDAEGRPVGEGDTLIQVATGGDLPAATMGLPWTVQRRTARRVQVVPAGWPPQAAPGVSRRRRSCPAGALRAARPIAGAV